MIDYIIRVVDGMPCEMHGAVYLDEEGMANIYINAALSYDAQRRALEHELGHVAYNHFYVAEESAEYLEREADEYRVKDE